MKFGFTSIKVTNNVKPKITIVNKVRGIVIKRNNGSYVVNHNNKLYNISPESFSCKNKKVIYATKLSDYNRYVKVLRSAHLCELDNNHYLPFRNKLGVIGKILKCDGIEIFHIVSIYNLTSEEEAIAAESEYKLNTNKIDDLINED